MKDTCQDLEQSDEGLLIFQTPDEVLEAAARATPGAAMSFPGSPTVSVLISCCSNDYTERKWE
jgi:hypothetical protein